MKESLHLILSTDATLQDFHRLGSSPWLQTMLKAYAQVWDVHFYTSDGVDYSAKIGVRHHPLGPRGRAPSFARHLLFNLKLLRCARQMRGVVRVMNPSLVFLPEIRRIARAPIILDFHYDWARTARAHYSGIKRLLAMPIQRRCFSASDIVLATTVELRMIAEHDYGRRAVVIPNFVDTDLFSPGDARRPWFVFAGRLHWGKGIKGLLEAFGAVAELHPECELILLGTGEQEAELRTQVPIAAAGRVRFLGPRPQEDVAHHLSMAIASMHPTVTTEGNPKALIEAMACGTPPIGTSVPGIADVIEDGKTGRLVPPGDAPALARAMLDLLEDRPQWERLSAACLIRSRRYSKWRILRHQNHLMRVVSSQRMRVG